MTGSNAGFQDRADSYSSQYQPVISGLGAALTFGSPTSHFALGDPGPSHWPNIGYGGGNVQPPLQHAFHSREAGLPFGLEIANGTDRMNNPNTYLWDRVELSTHQLQPVTPDLGVSIAHGSNCALIYSPSTLDTPGTCQCQNASSETAGDFNFVSGCRPIGAIRAQPASERYVLVLSSLRSILKLL